MLDAVKRIFTPPPSSEKYNSPMIHRGNVSVDDLITQWNAKDLIIAALNYI